MESMRKQVEYGALPLRIRKKGTPLSGHPLSVILYQHGDRMNRLPPEIRSGTQTAHFPKETLRHDTGISGWLREYGKWRG